MTRKYNNAKVEKAHDVLSEEDTALRRELTANVAETASAVQKAEEEGYARGLRDAKLLPEFLELQNRLIGPEPDDGGIRPW